MRPKKRQTIATSVNFNSRKKQKTELPLRVIEGFMSQLMVRNYPTYLIDKLIEAVNQEEIFQIIIDSHEDLTQFFSLDQIVEVAARNYLPIFKDFAKWGTELVILGYKVEKILKCARNLDYLYTHLCSSEYYEGHFHSIGTLTQDLMAMGLTHVQILAIAIHYSADATFKKLLEFKDDLFKLKFSIKQIYFIANHHHGYLNLESVMEYQLKLREEYGYSREDIAMFAALSAQALQLIYDNQDYLQTFYLNNLQIEQLFSSADVKNEGFKTFIANLDKLLSLGFNIDQCIAISSGRDGALNVSAVIAEFDFLKGMGFAFNQIIFFFKFSFYGYRTIAAVKEHGDWLLTKLDLEQIVKLISCVPGEANILTFKDYADDLNKIGYTDNQIIELLIHTNNRIWLIANIYGALLYTSEMLVYGFSLDDLTKILSNATGYKNVKTLSKYYNQLKELNCNNKMIVEIASIPNGYKNIKTFCKLANKLKELKCSLEDLKKLASFPNGWKNLEGVYGYFLPLKNLGYQKEEIITIGAQLQGYSALELLTNRTDEIMKLGYDLEQIINIATRQGAWHRLTMLIRHHNMFVEEDFERNEILDLVYNDYSAEIVDILARNYEDLSLTGFEKRQIKALCQSKRNLLIVLRCCSLIDLLKGSNPDIFDKVVEIVLSGPKRRATLFSFLSKAYEKYVVENEKAQASHDSLLRNINFLLSEHLDEEEEPFLNLQVQEYKVINPTENELLINNNNGNEGAPESNLVDGYVKPLLVVDNVALENPQTENTPDANFAMDFFQPTNEFEVVNDLDRDLLMPAITALNSERLPSNLNVNYVDFEPFIDFNQVEINTTTNPSDANFTMDFFQPTSEFEVVNDLERDLLMPDITTFNSEMLPSNLNVNYVDFEPFIDSNQVEINTTTNPSDANFTMDFFQPTSEFEVVNDLERDLLLPDITPMNSEMLPNNLNVNYVDFEPFIDSNQVEINTTTTSYSQNESHFESNQFDDDAILKNMKIFESLHFNLNMINELKNLPNGMDALKLICTHHLTLKYSSILSANVIIQIVKSNNGSNKLLTFIEAIKNSPTLQFDRNKLEEIAQSNEGNVKQDSLRKFANLLRQYDFSPKDIIQIAISPNGHHQIAALSSCIQILPYIKVDENITIQELVRILFSMGDVGQKKLVELIKNHMPIYLQACEDSGQPARVPSIAELNYLLKCDNQSAISTSNNNSLGTPMPISSSQNLISTNQLNHQNSQVSTSPTFQRNTSTVVLMGRNRATTFANNRSQTDSNVRKDEQSYHLNPNQQ